MTNVSDLFKVNQGHSNFDFVDVSLDHDTPLFIDPCLIDTGKSEFCKNARRQLSDYFDEFYDLYKKHSSENELLEFFKHSHEINATKLGYGNGNNGKANTPEGMVATFSSLSGLIDKNIPMSEACDLPIFIENFAEDRLSDMLTNILFNELNKFTLLQCKKYGVQNGARMEKINGQFYWDCGTHAWQSYVDEGLFEGDKLILLVPKMIVCQSLYYSPEQYFHSVILDRKQKETIFYDDKGKEHKKYKKDIRENILENATLLEVNIYETSKHPEYLNEYHLEEQYNYSNRTLSDEKLDSIVYKK